MTKITWRGGAGFIFCLAVFFLWGSPVQSAMYYVSTTGNDTTGNGSSGTPWRTIQKAANTAVAGDTVNVLAGTYFENVDLNTSGTSSQRITFQGVKDAEGEWLSIIDGSEAQTGWTLDTATCGAGCYKATPPYKVYWMGVDTNDIIRAEKASYLNQTATALWPCATGQNSFNCGQPYHVYVPWWDGFDVLWLGTGTGANRYADGANPGNVWVRFRNGDNPNSKNMRIGNNLPVVDLTNTSYVTVKDLWMRGGRFQVYLKGATNGNIIQGNKITTGGEHIIVEAGASNVAIKDNLIYRDAVSSLMAGPFSRPGLTGSITPALGTPEHLAAVREKYFEVTKIISYFEYGHAIRMTEAAGSTNIEISGNEIFDIIGDIINMTSVTNVTIANNILRNCSSSPILPIQHYTNLRIYGNDLIDCNINVRWHGLDLGGTKQVYMYNNKSWLSGNYGTHQYFFWNVDGAPAGSHDFTIYHNSFAGGNNGWQISPYGRLASLNGVKFFNNILSSKTWVLNSRPVGAFHYNVVGGVSPTSSPWAGTGNLVLPLAAGQQFWPPANLPSFILPEGSPGLEAGIDLSQAQTLGGVSYGPLPGLTPGYFPGAKPHVGAVQSAAAPEEPTGGNPEIAGTPVNTKCGSGTGSSCTVAYTVPSGTEKLLVVWGATRTSSAIPLPTVTYNGISMAVLIDQALTATNHYRAGVHYLDAASLPTTGSYNVVVTFPSSVDDIGMTVISVRNVPAGAAKATDTEAQASQTTATFGFGTAIAASDIVVAIGSIDDNDGVQAWTLGAGQQEIANLSYNETPSVSMSISYELGEATPSVTAVRPADEFIGLAFALGFAAPPAGPPVRSNPQPVGTLASGVSEVTISIETDVNCTCKYAAFANSPYDSMPGTFTTTGGTTHSRLAGGLQPNTTYHYRVRCRTPGGATNDSDFSILFTTGPELDDQPPTSPTALIITELTATSVSFTCTPGTDDIGIETQLIWRCDELVCDPELPAKVWMPASCAVADDALVDNRTYRYFITSVDTAGNESSIPLIAEIVTSRIPGRMYGIRFE